MKKKIGNKFRYFSTYYRENTRQRIRDRSPQETERAARKGKEPTNRAGVEGWDEERKTDTRTAALIVGHSIRSRNQELERGAGLRLSGRAAGNVRHQVSPGVAHAAAAAATDYAVR